MKNIRGKKTVVVGLSGGVDSSVAAALLKRQGFNVIGVYMKNWSEDVGDWGCTWAQDSEDARKVAQVLNIPFYVWNFEKEYYSKVVEYFFREYKANRTPNPDVMCNSEIKFKLFLEKALGLGADYVATGHYARVRQKATGKSFELLKGVDPAKDQSYFLYTLKQAQLSRVLFPIGDYKKDQIRALARKFKLPTAEKKDSQGICFIGKINVTEFLKANIKARTGVIVTTAGEQIGEHSGLPFYTIGQRGLNLGGNGPYYVVDKIKRTNKIVVTNDKNDPKLWRKQFILEDLSWTADEPKMPFKIGVTIRYHHPEYPAKVKRINKKELLVMFNKPQRAVTPGQSAVFYKGDILIGGGVIKEVL